MISISSFLDRVFEGVEIEEKVKKALVGLFFVGSYKAALELLIALKAKDKEFQNQLVQFFNSAVGSLDDKNKKVFEETIEKQGAKVLGEILQLFKDNLPDESRKKIEDNIQKLQQAPLKA